MTCHMCDHHDKPFPRPPPPPPPPRFCPLTAHCPPRRYATSYGNSFGAAPDTSRSRASRISASDRSTNPSPRAPLLPGLGANEQQYENEPSPGSRRDGQDREGGFGRRTANKKTDSRADK